MHQTLYRKWRPKTFSDVCGQQHVTSVLSYQVAHEQTSHAYLFCGSRGTGKTTCAKILAKAINCLSPINGNPCGVCEACKSIENGTATDVVEMDAASNRRIDDIREIRDDVAYAPAELKKRVFIIDEVHMLTGEAFNALLKTLEEPPDHIVFILATTELQKIPATILSRCQRFDFRRIESSVIVARLRKISTEEQINISDDALYLIAKTAKGGMRDAIGMLELCSAAVTEDQKEIDVQQAAELIGVTDTETLYQTVKAIRETDYGTLFGIVHDICSRAKDISEFWLSLSEMYRDLMLIRYVDRPQHFFDGPEQTLQRLQALSQSFTKETLLYHCQLIDRTLRDIRVYPEASRVMAENTLIRLCDPALDCSVDALASRIAAVETAIRRSSVTSQKSRTANNVTSQNNDVRQFHTTSNQENADQAKNEAIAHSSSRSSDDIAKFSEQSTSDTHNENGHTSPDASSLGASSVQDEQNKTAKKSHSHQTQQTSDSSAKNADTPASSHYRAFPYWQEAVEQFRHNDPMSAGLAENLRAFYDAQTHAILLLASDAFTYQMLNKPETLQQLKQAINCCMPDHQIADDHFFLKRSKEPVDETDRDFEQLLAQLGDMST